MLEIFILAPSSPEIHLYNVTTYSIRIQWRPPRQPNGIIRYYRIRYAVGSREIPSSHTNVTYVNTSAMFYNITSLKPGTRYAIRVAAFTVKLGPYSNDTDVETLVGSKSVYYNHTN